MTINPRAFRVMPISPCRALLMAAPITLAMVVSAAAQQQKHAAPALTQAAAEALLGGTSSVQETCGARTVNCRIVENRKACTFFQVRGNQRTGQRSFAIELRPPADGKTESVLVLPFGLALSAGVKLALDDNPLDQTVPFSTCVPHGGLAPVSFPTAAIDAIRKAKAMTITVAPSGGGEPVALAVGLDGFASAPQPDYGAREIIPGARLRSFPTSIRRDTLASYKTVLKGGNANVSRTALRRPGMAAHSGSL